MIPISVIIPTYNEEKNLTECLKALNGWTDDIHIVDSHSKDNTLNIAKSFNTKIHIYENNLVWPKKRQWAINNLKLKYEWILLLDADEILLTEIKNEIKDSIKLNDYNGFCLLFQMEFLGKRLRFAYPGLYKSLLFRKGFGEYERLLDKKYSNNELPIETHEHFIIKGKSKKLKNPILHKNVNNLHSYIEKHNFYSDWNAEVAMSSIETQIKPSIFGNQASRRRYFRIMFEKSIFYPILVFLYFFIFKLGFLDGKAGFYFCGYAAVQAFHINSKIYEKTIN
tara:strand:- start:62 stop:904 length:843 start_codon:yes stop_codon:yes gene_type:complete